MLLGVAKYQHLCRVTSSTSAVCSVPFPAEGVSCWFYYSHVSWKLLLNANSIDSDQTLCNVTCGLGLQSLPMFLLWDSGYKYGHIPRSNDQGMTTAMYMNREN